MAKDDIAPIQGASADARIHEAQKARANERLNNMIARQEETQEDFKAWADQALFNPINMRKRFEKLDDRMKAPIKKEEAQKEEQLESGDVSTDVIEQIAEDYYQRNEELQKKTLMLLQQRIKNDDDAASILRKVQEFYSDKSLADEAIDFLLETASTKEEMRAKLLQAKEEFNTAYGKDIRAGRNISEQVRNFSKQELGTPTGLRDLYRAVIRSPEKTPHQIYEELSAKFKFSDMKSIIDFILHSLGADMKAKGPSISKEELQRLFGEARTMQAILGVFRFFFSRMALIKGQFDRYDLTMPNRINFEALARLLMTMLDERYPSPDKIRQLAYLLGISEEVIAQIIIFTQYRDALRHISPKLFKSERHRQDLLLTLIEALSDLEDEMEEEEAEEEE